MVRRAAGRLTKNPEPSRPPISGGPYGYEHLNVAEQRRSPHSLLNWFERIIRMRKEIPEIGWGRFTIVNVGDAAVLSSRYDWRNNSVFFAHNLSAKAREIHFLTGIENDGRGSFLVNLFGSDHSALRDDGSTASCSILTAIAVSGSVGSTTCSSARRSDRPAWRRRWTSACSQS